MRIEQKILANLIHNEQYCRKVLPFLKKAYFSDRKEAVIIDEVIGFFNKYNKPASKEILSIEVGNRKDLNDKELAEAKNVLLKWKKNIAKFDVDEAKRALDAVIN